MFEVAQVQGSGFRVQGSGSRVQGSGFRVQGSVGPLIAPQSDFSGVECTECQSSLFAAR